MPYIKNDIDFTTMWFLELIERKVKKMTHSLDDYIYLCRIKTKEYIFILNSVLPYDNKIETREYTFDVLGEQRHKEKYYFDGREFRNDLLLLDHIYKYYSNFWNKFVKKQKLVSSRLLEKPIEN